MSDSTETESPQDYDSASCGAFIIPPDKHPITNQLIDRDALYVLKRLNEAGFSGYLVGGGVRDLYLGKTPKDFDISTDARPGQIRKLFPRSNTIGRRFRLVQVFFRGGKTVEVSTLRSLSEHDLDGPEAVLAPNNTFGTLSEDAQRRDLTINSLFYEIENGTIIDYVNGSRDLNDAIIKIVGDPEKRIRRDPVRMMRAIRHAARNNFTIADITWNSICSASDSLSLCPPSRLRDELLKDLYSGASAPWFKLAIDSGIFFSLFPFYRKIIEEKVSPDCTVKEQLQAIFSVVDRVNTLAVANRVHRQKDYFIIALLFIPWVESGYQLFSTHRKGAPLFHLGKQIREEINQTIGVELNLRRSLRQEAVSLLINLSQLIHNKQDNSWPKWLRKKSYFPQTLLFYQYFLEVTTGQPVELEITSPAKTPLPPAKDQDKRSPSKNEKPAFAPNTDGGVFGFRK